MINILRTKFLMWIKLVMETWFDRNNSSLNNNKKFGKLRVKNQKDFRVKTMQKDSIKK